VDINSRRRERRISDDELAALLNARDNITSSVPLGAIVRFALATSMRRGQILRIRRADVDTVGCARDHQVQPEGRARLSVQRDTVCERSRKPARQRSSDGIVFHLLRHEALSRDVEQRKFHLLLLQLIGGHRDIRHLTRYAKPQRTRTDAGERRMRRLEEYRELASKFRAIRDEIQPLLNRASQPEGPQRSITTHEAAQFPSGSRLTN